MWHPRLDADPAHRWLRDNHRLGAPGGEPTTMTIAETEKLCRCRKRVSKSIINEIMRAGICSGSQR
jgi:hypothetical protein